MQNSTIIIGYGNPDRGDDGVAWHILTLLAKKLGRDLPAPEDGFVLCGQSLELLFQLQLLPEIAETIADFDRVCFVDAHTGHVPDDLYVETLQPKFQPSPFTHHTTPHTCLEMANILYGKTPSAILVSVRGFDFSFTSMLSPQTSLLAQNAAQLIWEWIFKR